MKFPQFKPVFGGSCWKIAITLFCEYITSTCWSTFFQHIPILWAWEHFWVDLLQGNMLLIQTIFGLILCLQIGINFAQNPCEPNPCGKNTRCLTQPGSTRPVISCKCLPGTYCYRYSFMFFYTSELMNECPNWNWRVYSWCASRKLAFVLKINLYGKVECLYNWLFEHHENVGL